MSKKCDNCGYKGPIRMECPECGQTVCQGCWVFETRQCYRCFRQRPKALPRVVLEDFAPLDEDQPVSGLQLW